MQASPVDRTGHDLTAESPLLKPFSSDGCLELMVTKGKLKSVMADQANPDEFTYRS